MKTILFLTILLTTYSFLPAQINLSPAQIDTISHPNDRNHDGLPDDIDLQSSYSSLRPGEVNPKLLNDKSVDQAQVLAFVESELGNSNTLQLDSFKITPLIFPSIKFEKNSYSIPFSYYRTISRIAKYLRKNRTLRLVITGYANHDAPANLSQKRANEVIQNFITNYEVNPDRLILRAKNHNTCVYPPLQENTVEFRIALKEEK